LGKYSRFSQYLQPVELDKDSNTIHVNIVFPMDIKKVLMLTIAEQTLEQVLVR